MHAEPKCQSNQTLSKAVTTEQLRVSQPLFLPSERFHLDRESPVPLYHQMETAILERINAEMAVGRMLPREVDLAKIFGVSRITVKKVTDSLAAKGVIKRQRAVGTHIIGLGVKEDLGRLTGYTEQMAARGLRVSTEVLGVGTHRPAIKVREKLKLKPTDVTLFVRRLRGTSQVFPLVFLQSEIPVHYGIDPKEDFSGSLYALIEDKYRIPIVWGEEEISAARASAEEARQLRIRPGDVVLVMERLTYTHGDRPLEFVRAVYLPEHYTFTIRLRR
jgi:GntR family transcriptional regulator